MPWTTKTCGAVILAGGASRRMGTCKALLKIGGETLLARLARQLATFEERLLSANDPALGEGLPLRRVADQYPGAGPLAGLQAALSAAEKEALFCLPCDLPCYSPQLAQLLLERFPAGARAMICRDSTGRVHPLCGIYTKGVLPALNALLESGERRVMALVQAVDAAVLDTGGLLPDQVFFNMNTPESFQHLIQETQETGGRF